MHDILNGDPTTTLHSTVVTSEEPQSQIPAMNSKEEEVMDMEEEEVEYGGRATRESSCAESQDLFLTPSQSSQSNMGKPSAGEGILGNCIGSRNMRNFIMFCLYTSLACLDSLVAGVAYISAVLSMSFANPLAFLTLLPHSISQFFSGALLSSEMFVILMLYLWLGIGLACAGFCSHQILLILRGQTRYQVRKGMVVRPIAALTGRGSPLQANGGCRKGSQHIFWPTLLPPAPIGLEQRTAANGSRDWPNLQTQQPFMKIAYWPYLQCKYLELLESQFPLVHGLSQLRLDCTCSKQD
ncbi:Putative palmitoyltransferase ZDHHC22 [Chelonia mydas]|uniref:Palmitoyltransferase n=1 Tax=Chelonia mydas TaxID=8469 RepID=M7AWB4_CHEMY|nr:Putative palmitoyltransferase ZDHHC22 [Chelonia mydas]